MNKVMGSDAGKSPDSADSVHSSGGDVVILPCPFCGGDATCQGDDDDDSFYVACCEVDCFAAVGEGTDRYGDPDHVFKEPLAAIAAWNRRPVESIETAEGGESSSICTKIHLSKG